MINFLNPTILFALIAGLIPLIIHLLNRRKIKEIRFSTIHFLKQMSRKEMRRLRIRQILLLIIRTLIILLLVLAFARPTLRSGAGLLAGRTASEVVVIIDNSLSLNSLELTGSLLEKVRQRWAGLETAFQSGDRVSVILGVKPLRVLADRQNYSPGFWEKVTRQIQPTYLTGNLTEAVLKAAQIFRESELFNKELYLISDFQRAGFEAEPLKILKEEWNEKVNVFCLPVFHGEEENVSVDSAGVSNRLVEKNQVLKITARVRNQNDRKHLTSLISLILNDNRAGQQNVSLAPQEEKPIRFRTTLQSGGFVTGFVECEGDVLLEDNRYYFNFFVPENIRILHIVPNPRFASFVPLILKPAVDRGLFVTEQKMVSQWASLELQKYQAVILEGIDQIPAGLASRLVQYGKAGNGVLILPGSNIVPAQYNHLLKSLGLGQIVSREGTPGQKSEFITPGKINWQHPLFEGMFEKRRELNPIYFYGYYRVKPRPGDEVIIRLKNSAPFLIGSRGDSRNVYLFAAPLQPEWTNLPVRGFVVPLFYRLLYYVVTRNVPERSGIEVGEPYAAVFKTVKPPYHFILRRPSGDEEKLTPIFKGNDILIRIDKNPEPGNYQVWQDGHLLTVYSVNHSPLESRREYYGKEELQAFFPDFYWIPSGENVLKIVETSRFGQELWPYLLGFVLFLLLVEMVLAYTGGRQQARQLRQELAAQ